MLEDASGLPVPRAVRAREESAGSLTRSVIDVNEVGNSFKSAAVAIVWRAMGDNPAGRRGECDWGVITVIGTIMESDSAHARRSGGDASRCGRHCKNIGGHSRGGERHKGEGQGRDGFRADDHRYLLKGGF